MNLFSRLSEILDDGDKPIRCSTQSSHRQIDRLVCEMDANLAQTKQAAVALIAAERVVACELSRQLNRQCPDGVLLERLREEHIRARLLKCAVKKTLSEMREGLDQATLFRDTICRYGGDDVGRRLATWRRLFWKAYHRLCDLADERLDQFESQDLAVPTQLGPSAKIF
jgi:hypothetical protein